MAVAARALVPVALLDLPVHPVTLQDALDVLEAAIARRTPTHVVSLNGALIMQAIRDVQLAEVIRRAGLVIPDGVGVILAARILRLALRRRTPGVDLAEALCARAAERGHRVFLLGAAPGVAAAAASRLAERCPGIRIVGTAHGFFESADEPALLDSIRKTSPDVLLVALGAPRQEIWLDRNARVLGIPVMMGVGGTLDVLAGRVRRAPGWMRALGLE